MPSDLGREAGLHLARFAEAEGSRLKEAGISFEEPCAGCAFRRGTYANGCAATILDAIEMTADANGIFTCHEAQRRGQACAGWKLLSGFYNYDLPLNGEE